MLAKGDNTFKLPHKHKLTAQRLRAAIPADMVCSVEAWEAAQSALAAQSAQS